MIVNNIKISKLRQREDGTFEEVKWRERVNTQEEAQRYYQELIKQDLLNKKKNENINNRPIKENKFKEELKINNQMDEIEYSFLTSKKLNREKESPQFMRKAQEILPPRMRKIRLIGIEQEDSFRTNGVPQFINLKKGSMIEEVYYPSFLNTKKSSPYNISEEPCFLGINQCSSDLKDNRNDFANF